MALQTQQKRNTAYKTWIGDLFKGNISLNENRFNFIESGNKKIVRVNFIANVVDKYESNVKPFASLTLDDSSGQIRAKTFDNVEYLTSFNIGNTVLVIGMLRFFNNELYLLPEIIKQVDEKWLLVRKLELGEPLKQASEHSMEAQGKQQMQIGTTQTEQAEPAVSAQPKIEVETMKIGEEKIGDTVKVPEKVIGESGKVKETEEVSSDIKSVLYEKIKANEQGVDIDALIMSVSFPVVDINTTITDLIEEGKIYEPQPGRLRSI